MMRLIKIFSIIIFALTLISTKTFAAMPDISAGETKFDIFNGCYILKNNVKVIHQGRTMTANQATVKVADQKVWASGNVTLVDNEIKFNCDKIFVEGFKKNVTVIGGVDFFQDNALKIICDVGNFSWDNKIADFYGHVKIKIDKSSKVKLDKNLEVNLKKINGTYDHIQYNIVEKKLILLDKKFDRIPAAEYPESDPTE